MKKKFRSFSVRLTRSVVLTVLVTMTIISVLIFFFATAIASMFIEMHYFDIADKTNGNIELIMSNVEISARNIVDEANWHLNSPQQISSTLEYELTTNPHLVGCGIGFIPDYYPEQGKWFEPYVSFRDSIATCAWIGSESHDYFQSEWYRRGIESPTGVWTSPYFDPDGAGAILCTFAAQVRKEGKDEVVGVFGVDITLEKLYAVIEEIDRKQNIRNGVIADKDNGAPENRIYSFIIGQGGEYIVHPDKSRILKGTFFDYADSGAEDYRKLGEDMLAGKRGKRTVTMDGIETTVFYAPLQRSGWSMGVAVPSRVIFAPSFLIGAVILLLILVGLMIVFVVCYIKIRRATKPLISLTESVNEVSKGNFDTKLPEIKTHDEIRLLRDSFDNMQKSLSEYVRELTETTARNASMENELAVARSIQMSMLPMAWSAFPDRTDLSICGDVMPAKAVGGDLFDFLIRDEKLFFCVGDVSGKGIPASLVMAVVSSLFRTLCKSEDNPASILSSLNASMSARNERLMFVTLFIGCLDLSTGDLLYANAGHNTPVVIRDRKPALLETDANIPLGIQEDWAYSLQQTILTPDTVLFLYTDGLTEATREGGELFGEERLLQKLSALGDNHSARDYVLHMNDAVKAFVGDSEQSDDLTMLVIKRVGSPRNQE